MTNHKKLSLMIALMIIASMVLSACGGLFGPGEPVQLNWNLGTEPPTLDPSLATDTTSVDVIRNTFMGLTQFDPVTGEVQPYMAESWESGTDGDGNPTFTFHLRDDIKWVNYDPATGETSVVGDVTAADVEYGVKRTLDPETGSAYSYVLYIVKNGAAVNGGEEGFTLDDVGVEATDDTTVVFTLESEAPFFPAIAGMWVAHAMPQATIEEFGEEWTEPGNIVTNGPYVLESWIHGSELSLVKNSEYVFEKDVQITRVYATMIQEASTAFAMYENNELDTVAPPLPEMDRIKADPVLSEELYIAPALCTYYYGFNNMKAPFDDQRVRYAFSRAIDRQSLVDNVLKGGQIPSSTFAPPGIFGADPAAADMSYNPDAANASLQAYLDENGMTIDDFNAMGITLMHNTSEGHAQIAAAIQQMWTDTLGVEVNVENQEWSVYLTTIGKTTPIEDAPHVYRLGWCADYPDQNNWVHEVFNSEAGANRLRRNCADPNCEETTGPSTFDELTAQAGVETDSAKRAELYSQAEKLLAEDEAAYASIYYYSAVAMTKPWLTRNYPQLGGNDWFKWTIDTDLRPAE